MRTPLPATALRNRIQQYREGPMNVSAVRAIVQGVCVASFVAFPATMRTAVSAQQASRSIRHQLHQSASFARVVVTTYDPARRSDLVGRADLSVEAATAAGVPF